MAERPGQTFFVAKNGITFVSRLRVVCVVSPLNVVARGNFTPRRVRASYLYDYIFLTAAGMTPVERTIGYIGCKTLYGCPLLNN